ncbi:MAG: histidine triad family protein [bacterium]|nr:histidine triad family protein [bacterium]
MFCKIVRGELPSNKLYEDDKVLVIKDINPQAPFHALVISKDHIKSLVDVEDFNLISHMFRVIKEITISYKLAEKGFRVVNNCGDDGGQTVYHIHFHILGGRAMDWPPG